MFSKLDIFEARTNGYHTYRIPGLCVTQRGSVLATCEARPGQGGDYDFNDVLMRRSTDGGKTFGVPITLVDHNTYGNGPVSNFCLIADACSPRIVAVFCHDYARVFTMHSNDDGVSFSEPRDITEVFKQFHSDYPWCVCATGPGHGTQLRNGRMIIPVWLSDGSTCEFGPNHRGHRPSIVTSIHSDDGGTTWQRGDIVCRDGDTIDDAAIKNPSETVAAELTDGSVMFNMRSESASQRRLVAISPDGVTNWQVRGFDEALLEPICMASLIRCNWPNGDEPGRLVFANPDVLEKTMVDWALDRKQLTVKLSEDDGKTWCNSRILEAGPAGYSDLALLPDGTILCLYECDIIERMCDDRYVRLARFDMDWLNGTT